MNAHSTGSATNSWTQRAPFRSPRVSRVHATSQPNSQKNEAQYTESAPHPRTTSGHGPLFFMIAGIHESVANQKATPDRNHQRADTRLGETLETSSSGATAKQMFSASPRSAKALHIRVALTTAAAIRHQVPFSTFII